MSVMVLVSGTICVVALIYVALIDQFTFEINFEALGVAVVSGLVAVFFVEGKDGIYPSVVAAVVLVFSLGLAHRFKRGHAGKGDYWLFGAVGLLAGADWLMMLMPVLMVFVVVAAVWWSQARRKSILTVRVPVAPPLILAFLPMFIGRICGVIPPQPIGG